MHRLLIAFIVFSTLSSRPLYAHSGHGVHDGTSIVHFLLEHAVLAPLLLVLVILFDASRRKVKS